MVLFHTHTHTFSINKLKSSSTSQFLPEWPDRRRSVAGSSLRLCTLKLTQRPKQWDSYLLHLFLRVLSWGSMHCKNLLCISNTTKEPELTLINIKSKQVQASKCSISVTFLEKVLNQKALLRYSTPLSKTSS